MLNLYKFSNYNNSEYIYVGNYNTLFKYSDLLNDILELASDHTVDEIDDNLKNKYSSEMVKEQATIIKDWFLKIDGHNKKKLNDINHVNWLNGSLLTALWLNISYDCNLRCIYCYGNGGDYGLRRELMTVETAKKIIDYWFRYVNKYSKEISVIFFGGEPLMNQEVLFFAVKYINELFGTGVVKYSLTTNGTIMDKQILDLFEKNMFRITLSIDGGEEIQDINRPFLSGKGTFNKIRDTVGFLRKSFNRLTARITLTHETAGQFKNAVKDLWDIGISDIAFDVVSSTDKSLRLTKEDIKILKPQIFDLAKVTYKNILNNDKRYIATFLKFGKLMHNHAKNDCVFFSKNILMVGPDGDVFKCQRLMGEKDFLVGNIFTEINWEKYFDSKKVYWECQSCWANNLCFNCPENNYRYNNNIYQPYQLLCHFNKIIIGENLKIYSSLYEKHPQILKGIYKL